MLELVHLDSHSAVFRHVYPRSLGFFILFVVASFAVFDVLMGLHAPRDVPPWGLWGLFVPVTVFLAWIAWHLLVYRRTLQLVPFEGAYTLGVRTTFGERTTSGRLDEFRHVIVVATRSETAQAWLAWKDDREPLLHLAARVGPDPRSSLNTDFCAWIGATPVFR